MKRLLILIGLLAIAAVAADPNPQMSVISAEADSANLVVDNASLVSFAFNATPGPGGNSIVEATLQFTKGQDSFELNSQTHANDHYEFVLPISKRQLTVGEWKVTGVAVDAIGRTNYTSAATFTTTAPEVAAFKLLLNNATEADTTKVLVSPNRSPVVTVATHDQPYLLKEVLWRTNQTWRTLNSEILHAKDFDAKSGTLDILLKDRLGRSSTFSTAFTVDASAPNVNLTVPSKLFSVVNNTLSISTNEETTFGYKFNGKQSAVMATPTAPSSFELNVDIPGIYTLAYTVRDNLGNTAQATRQLEFVRPTTAVSLENVTTDGTQLLLGDSFNFTAIWNQTEGAAPASVIGNVTARGVHEEIAFTLPKTGSQEWTQSIPVGPGQYQFFFDTLIASKFNQTENLTVNHTILVEVFIGKTVSGDMTYFIRTNAQGFPVEAVKDGEIFPLVLRREGKGLIYEIGETGLYWDSSSKITTIAPPASSSSSKATPAPFGIVFVGLAALALRRR